VGEESGVAVQGRGFGVAIAESGHGSERHRLVVEAASVREGGVLGGSWGWRVQPGGRKTTALQHFLVDCCCSLL